MNIQIIKGTNVKRMYPYFATCHDSICLINFFFVSRHSRVGVYIIGCACLKCAKLQSKLRNWKLGITHGLRRRSLYTGISIIRLMGLLLHNSECLRLFVLLSGKVKNFNNWQTDHYDWNQYLGLWTYPAQTSPPQVEVKLMINLCIVMF